MLPVPHGFNYPRLKTRINRSSGIPVSYLRISECAAWNPPEHPPGALSMGWGIFIFSHWPTSLRCLSGGTILYLLVYLIFILTYARIRTFPKCRRDSARVDRWAANNQLANGVSIISGSVEPGLLTGSAKTPDSRTSDL